jgi:hypothetical protein
MSKNIELNLLYYYYFFSRTRLRICNIRNLSIHKHEKLQLFPELNRFMMYHDEKLISKYTSVNLNFSSEKYHLGCLLVYDYRVQDRCISKLTIEGKEKKNDSI